MSAMNRKRRWNRSSDRRGASLVAMVFLIVVVIGMTAFSMEVGRMYLLHNQIQKAVDAGTLAATLKLIEDPDATTEAAAAAEQFIQANRVGLGVEVAAESIAVEIGQWDNDTKVFTVTGTDPNAVRVTGTQDNEPFFFARIFGQTVFSSDATAIASGSGGPLDIMMVLDLSGSMSSNGRIQALRNAAPTFVDVIEEFGGDDQVGVMGYGCEYDEWESDYGSGSRYLLAPASQLPGVSNYFVGVLEADLTVSFSDLRTNTLTSSELSASKYGGGTPIGAAIRDAAHYLDNSSLARDDARKIIILMSDGAANKPSGSGSSYALQMADYAATLDVKVYTISLGSSADVDLMENIAERTGAQHFDATGSGGGESQLTQTLRDAFKRAAAALKRPQLVQ